MNQFSILFLCAISTGCGTPPTPNEKIDFVSIEAYCVDFNTSEPYSKIIQANDCNSAEILAKKYTDAQNATCRFISNDCQIRKAFVPSVTD